MQRSLKERVDRNDHEVVPPDGKLQKVQSVEQCTTVPVGVSFFTGSVQRPHTLLPTPKSIPIYTPSPPLHPPLPPQLHMCSRSLHSPTDLTPKQGYACPRSPLRSAPPSPDFHPKCTRHQNPSLQGMSNVIRCDVVSIFLDILFLLSAPRVQLASMLDGVCVQQYVSAYNN